MTAHQATLNEDALLQNIVDGTAGETGAGFFRALVQNLSLALGTHGAWVTEYLPEAGRLRALAFWLDGAFVDHYEYDIVGTPCEPTLKNKTYLHIPDRVVELFPGDADLPQMSAVSYMGFPLIDSEGEILGNLAVVDTKTMPESFRRLALFRIFTARATAELLRVQAENALRAKEEKLTRLFNGAMDAIVELDHELRILMMNPAAAHIFGCGRAACLGRALETFVAPADFTRLGHIVRRLKANPDGERRAWIPEGLAVLQSDGSTIPTEATLSQIEIASPAGYVLILRDVKDRYEAQQTIASLRDATEYLQEEIQALYNTGEIIGQSAAFRQTLQAVAEVSATDSTVLINGATGTGKELIARAIHAASLRQKRPLVTVNCAAIPDALMESEFFGHEKGAFTGATQRREGRFAIADGGTIFLDEVGELNRELQAKLLRVLQEGEFTPIGAARTQHADVRVIAATNRDLSREVREGRFRTDLYYRLNVFPITVPPLNKRGDDIRLLAEHFTAKFAARMGREVLPLSVECIERLQAYDWPGNVRELQNVIERGVITARRGRINLDHALPPPGDPVIRTAAPAPDADRSILTVRQLQDLERRNILRALEACRWRVAGTRGAAQRLGMPASTLQSRMKSLAIRRPRSAPA
jgi:PAS domain S-box-containing protein